MRTSFSALVLFFVFLSIQSSYGYSLNCQVSQADIYEGYIIKKIWLTEFAVPKVSINNISWTANVALPKDAILSDPSKFNVSIGMERKRPFAVVRIPAYTAGINSGTVNQVSSYNLEITESLLPQNKQANKTDVTTSALNTGTWYKIAVTNTGFYKLDYNFLTSMGLKPADINPANIRVLGNGGAMLSEKNAVTRPVDLIENSILFNGNADNVFDNDEYVVFYGVGTMT